MNVGKSSEIIIFVPLSTTFEVSIILGVNWDDNKKLAEAKNQTIKSSLTCQNSDPHCRNKKP